MYQDNIEAKLRDLDQQIDALKVKIGKQKKVDRKQLEQEMAELDRKREAAHQDFEKLKNSSQEAWRDMKVGIEAAMEDLETAYEQAASHFK
jgi:restriction endonuclease S subunit